MNKVYATAMAMVRGLKKGYVDSFAPGTILVARVYRYACLPTNYSVEFYGYDGACAAVRDIEGKAAVARALQDHLYALAEAALPKLFGEV